MVYLSQNRRDFFKNSAVTGIGAVMATAVGGRVARADGHSDTGCAKSGYNGVPRPNIWSPNDIEYTDTSKYKKDGPYKIGFSNAGLGDTWRVVMLHSMQAAIARNKSLVSDFIVTDANHNDAKQVSDIEDLISQGVDLLIVSANTSDALDPVVSRAMRRDIPVVMTDRSVTSGNYVSFATAADAPIGRMMAQWLVEKLNYAGNVIILSGMAGASPDTNRVVPAM